MRVFVFSLCVVALLFAIPATAHAQTNATANETPTYVSENIGLVESGFNNETGTAYVVLTSEVPESVTVSDAGSLSQGSGPIDRSTAVVDGRTRIEVGATVMSSGRVQVAIDTDDVLYGEVVRNGTDSSDELVGGPFDARDAQLVGGSAAITVALVILIQMARYKLGRSHEPERVA